MASSSSSSHSTPESSAPSFEYDVFLSFRGEDTRKTFVDHLYSSLVDRNIYVYKDDESLPRGESIGPSLFKAIEESQIAVVIFSQNYANSSWCLEEISHITKCKEEKGLIVMPVFYDVDPSEVRKQKGKFEKAFSGLEVENISKTESWKKALVDVSNISGWELKNTANGHESTIIKKIVDEIVKRMLSFNPEEDEDLVGINSRLQELERRLEVGSGGVRMVGIWGIGGSGKTTLATSIVRNVSSHFKSHYTVENIREESGKNGLKKLQENLLSTGFKTKVEVNNMHEGKDKLKRMFRRSNVLLILDDVDDVGQLQALAGSHNWFGSGSRIIITTRDEHLLKTHKVDAICPVNLFSQKEAIKLFRKSAYNEEKPIKNYDTLSLRVVSYAAGLPLALRVLGSFLYDKDEKEWMSSLARLNDIPEMEVVKKLKISYDGLNTMEKDMFLDIACFFRGKPTSEPMKIFEACGYHPTIGIKVLKQKSLINIGKNMWGHPIFVMHDLVQEMGHYIVRGEPPHNTEKYSRVWKIEDLESMCFRDATMENYNTVAISDEHTTFNMVKFVSNMKKLRWLILGGCNSDNEEPNFLSNKLRYPNCDNCPGSSFPDNFEARELVVLELKDSPHEELWKGYKYLGHLKTLTLMSMYNLRCTPNFEGLPCLQSFILQFCGELEEIHPSLGKHSNIECINVIRCHKLRMFPTIVRMNKLNTLIIRNCGAIQEFPEIQTNLKSLVTLSLYQDQGIKFLPSSIGVRCSYLRSLSLDNCLGLKSIDSSFHDLKHLKEFRWVNITQTPLILLETVLTQMSRNLKKLCLYGCGLKDGEIPHDIVELSHLQELDLSSNYFTRLEINLLQLTRLKFLELYGCRRLVELPALPSSVAILRADRCNSLTTVGDCYTNCEWLSHVSLMHGGVVIDGSRLLEAMLLQGKAVENQEMFLKVEGCEIAKAFRRGLVRGGRWGLKLEENWCNDYSGFLLCSVFADEYFLEHPEIGIRKQEMMSGDEPEGDIQEWEESDDSKRTVVWYVPFASFRDSTWWKHTSQTTGVFSINFLYPYRHSGFGVGLVARENGSCLSTTQQEEEQEEEESSEFFSYIAPKFQILGDSQHAISFNLRLY